MQIDLNSDIGESFGAYRLGADEAVLESITSANVACGYHAGDPGVMRRTVRLAVAAGVAIGAHPGFPDLAGFGRREMRMAIRDVEDMLLYQIGALAAIAGAEGGRLTHVKAHGALYNMAVKDSTLADAIARAVRTFDRGLILFGLPGSELLRAGRDAGLNVAAEGFADRAYEPDGTLTSRTRPGSLIEDADAVVSRAVRMVTDRRVTATNGADLTLDVQTLCTHGDTPGAAELTRRIREGLEHHHIAVRAVSSGGARA